MTQANKSQLIDQVAENCSIVFFSTRLFSPDRSTGKRNKDGALIESEMIEIIDRQSLLPLRNAGNEGERACRQLGTRIDALSAWMVPDTNVSRLRPIIERAVKIFEERKKDLLVSLPTLIDKQVEKYPHQENQIRTAAPSIRTLDESIRIFWMVKKLDVSDTDNYGMAREFDSLGEQAAWEIAQDVKTSVGKGARYTRKTLEVLARAAHKAESFGFLSESLRAVKPAVDKLLDMVRAKGNDFDMLDNMIIGGLIAFLSNSHRLINEGRHIGSVFTSAEKSVAKTGDDSDGDSDSISQEQNPVATSTAPVIPAASTTDPIEEYSF